MKVFAHIGQPKTGTSAIQGFLNHNREKLAERKILYPNFDGRRFDAGRLHNHAAFFLKTQQGKDPDDCVRAFMDCVDFCRGTGIHTIIISNEGWRWHWWPGLLKRMFEVSGLDYQFILYLRRQDRYLEAAWKQWGHKVPGCDSIQEYRKQLELNWYKVLTMWTTHFDASKFTVRPYERTQIGDDIVKDFCGLVGIGDLSGLEAPPATNMNVNTGLSWHSVEVLRLCKNLVNDVNDHTLIEFLNETLSDNHKKKPLEAYAFLSPQERLDVIAEYTPLNDLIAERFLGRSEGGLFQEALPDVDEQWEPAGDLALKQVVPIFMEIMLKQQQQIRALTERIEGT